MIPDANDYWSSLTRAINASLRASSDRTIRFIALDDIKREDPDRLDAKTVRCAAWMLGDAKGEPKYELFVRLDRKIELMQQSDWDELLKCRLSGQP